MHLPTVGAVPTIDDQPVVPAPTDKIKHAQTRQLLQTLHDCGWRYLVPRPGGVLFSHPLCDVEVPTPDHMRAYTHSATGAGRLGPYPFETYTMLRQLDANLHPSGDRLAAVFLRESSCPWVPVSIRPVSFRRAIAYVREDWSPLPKERDPMIVQRIEHLDGDGWHIIVDDGARTYRLTAPARSRPGQWEGAWTRQAGARGDTRRATSPDYATAGFPHDVEGEAARRALLAAAGHPLPEAAS
jgi:hypothetical protein